MTESTTELPAIGAEVLVTISPSIKSDEKWLLLGQVRTVRHDPTDLICATIEVSRSLKAEKNRDSFRSDDTWNGAVIAAVLDKYRNRWRATCPVSDLAKAVWAKCWESENGN